MQTPSERDIKIVQLIANDTRREQIAIELDKSLRTIESLVIKIKAEWNCKHVTGLVATFFRNGFIK